ncbi:hypothetical protein JW879_04555 [candidate division WOR-3 bacterium]|nr:hypothetical protein [candidate division WOR-3 bacterium]
MAKSKKRKFDDISIMDYQRLADAFIEETDRGAAILAASYAEDYLGKYLTSFMVDDPKIDELFESFGPYKTFSQRIKAAYAFGLIDINKKNDLQIIKDIRNNFAHNFRIKTFENPKVNSLFDRLTIAKFKGMRDVDSKYMKLNLRGQYIMTVARFVLDAHNDMLKRKESKKR